MHSDRHENVPRLKRSVATTDVSTLRLYALRATYMLVAVGVGVQTWPALLDQALWNPMQGMANSLLAAVTLMAIVGIRYPLQMLPLLLLELTWRALWLGSAALPLWAMQDVDAFTAIRIWNCVIALVILPAAIPWRYVRANYMSKRGDRWFERRSFYRAPDGPPHHNH